MRKAKWYVNNSQQWHINGENLNRKEIQKAHELYMCGMSLSQVGKRIGICRKRLHYYFKVVGLPTRPPKRKDYILYNGDKYTLYKEGYYRKTDGNRDLLHRAIWSDAYGEIPKDYQVHHKDENKTNNNLDNLELIHIAEHTKLHGFKNNYHTKRNPDKYKNRKKNNCLICKKEIWGDKYSPSYYYERKYCSKTCKKRGGEEGQFMRGKSAC